MNHIARKKRVRSGIRDDDGPIRCTSHLQWIRGCACIVNDVACGGKPVAAHCRLGTDGGTSMKPGDNFTNPMCWNHHEYQHLIGEPAFQKQYKIDLKASAERHWAQSPHRRKYELSLAQRSAK